jgi:hypothetical protein
LSHRVFNAIVDTHALIFQKSKSVPQGSIVAIDQWDTNKPLETHALPQSELPHDGSPINVFSPIDKQSLYRKIMGTSATIAHFCFVYNGVKPFELGKGNPPQTKKIVTEQPFVVEGKRPAGKDWLPLLRGSLIQRYSLLWQKDYWIKYGPWLAAPRDQRIFDADDKIMVRQTGDRIIAARIPAGFIARNNLHILICRPDVDARFILAILNSRLTDFVYSIMNPEKGEALAEVKKMHVEQLPVKTIDDPRSRDLVPKIIICVDQISELTSALQKARSPQDQANIQRRIDAADHQLNQLVYRLFGLSETDIQTIERSDQDVEPKELAPVISS